MSKLQKVLKISLITIILLVVLVIAFISPLTKYLVERFDKKYTGREITMDWAYVNPFTGYLHFSNLKIYEFESDSIFLSTKGLSANFEMFKLLSKTYEISDFTIDRPQAIIFQNQEYFNFNDLISKFSSNDTTAKKKGPVHFSILNIKIINGLFSYREIVTPFNYFIKNVNIESAGYRWDADTIPIQFSFLPGIGSGDIKGNFTLNSKSNDYRLAVLVHQFDLNIVGQYIKDLANYGTFKAFLNADFKSDGNLIERDNVTSSGLVSISDFHFGKDSLDDFAAFDNLTVAIHEVSPKKFIYFFDSISLKHPFLKYEKYDYLDNVQTMFGENGVNVTAANTDGAKFNLVIEIVKYLRTISKNLLRSNFKINRMAIYDGEIKYNDYSMGKKFSIAINPFTFMADSVDKTHERVYFNLASSVKPYGSLALGLSINPKDSSDFDLRYSFQKLPISMFNPYLIKYTSFPLDRGTIEIKGLWKVRNGQIASTNHLVIIDPRVGEKTSNKFASWLPLNLAMFFVKERGNVIDYDVPITGNLNNPKFILRDVIGDALKNIFVKPLTTPYRFEVRNTETEIENWLSLKWEMRRNYLSSRQETFLEDMADFLKKNPEATIKVIPQNFEEKEKEYILFYEAKKKYFLTSSGNSSHSYNENDSTQVEKMSIKDVKFMAYLNKMVPDSMLFTIQDKCMKLVGANLVDAKFNNLKIERLNEFLFYFRENGTEKRLIIASGENVIPYNGFSFYKIQYTGVYPNYLLKAYKKMNELNNDVPRVKFKSNRQKIGKSR